MDHTPGQRQFADLDRLRTYMVGKHGIAPTDFEAYIAERQALGNRVRAAHEAAAVAGAKRLRAILASHDDTTTDHVTTSAAHGAGLAEFPTTLEAARACRAHGIAVMLGGPNLIRGGSHSGNVSALEAAEAGLLDIISSDYIPASLLMGAIALARQSGDLPAGIATVTPQRRPRRRPHRSRRAGAGSAWRRDPLSRGERHPGRTRHLGEREAGGLRRGGLRLPPAPPSPSVWQGWHRARRNSAMAAPMNHGRPV